MIKLISHRGNLNGPDPRYENSIFQIDYALSKGFEVEIDVWKLPDEDCFRLGHDKPIMSQSVPLWYLENPKLWIHCKNKDAEETLNYRELINCFSQEDQDYSIGSNKTVWFHSRVLPGDLKYSEEIQWFEDKGYWRNFTYFVNCRKQPDWDFSKLNYGICSDFIETYK